MKFEEQFPSLKGKVAYPLKYKIPFKEHPFIAELSDIGQDILKNDYIEVEVYPENVIQKHCLDKAKAINLTEDETHNLIVRGECKHNGLKITALYPNQSHILRILKQEHILLEDYKAVVEKAIDESIIMAKAKSRVNRNNEIFGTEAVIKLIEFVLKQKLGLK